MEVVRRSLRLVDKLIIGPAINIGKGPLFSLEERVEMLKDDISDFAEAERKRIEIVPFEGLLIHFARQIDAKVIIRGLRAVSDFEYEIQMANMGDLQNPGARARVFRLDLNQPVSIFVAQQFGMQAHDVIYVTNAPLYEYNKIVTALYKTFSIVGVARGNVIPATSF